MVLKLYGLHASHFVRLVAAVLIEKEVPFELIKVDLSKGEQKTPEFLAKHPFGQVPFIVRFPSIHFDVFVVVDVTWLGR